MPSSDTSAPKPPKSPSTPSATQPKNTGATSSASAVPPTPPPAPADSLSSRLSTTDASGSAASSATSPSPAPEGPPPTSPPISEPPASGQLPPLSSAPSPALAASLASLSVLQATLPSPDRALLVRRENLPERFRDVISWLHTIADEPFQIAQHAAMFFEGLGIEPPYLVREDPAKWGHTLRSYIFAYDCDGVRTSENLCLTPAAASFLRTLTHLEVSTGEQEATILLCRWAAMIWLLLESKPLPPPPPAPTRAP